MRRTIFCVVILMAVAPVAMGQAVTGFTGGSQFSSYCGQCDRGRDRIPVRGELSLPIEVAMLGVWNEDTAAGFPGLTSTHQVGIWDSCSDPAHARSRWIRRPEPSSATGSTTAITPVTLSPGEAYTVGVPYTPTDNDQYISSASSLTTAPNVTFGSTRCSRQAPTSVSSFRPETRRRSVASDRTSPSRSCRSSCRASPSSNPQGSSCVCAAETQCAQRRSHQTAGAESSQVPLPPFRSCCSAIFATLAALFLPQQGGGSSAEGTLPSAVCWCFWMAASAVVGLPMMA